MRKIILMIAGFCLSAYCTAMKISYKLSFPEPQTHYIVVEATIKENSKKAVDLKMPVWTPGSYLVREFSRHIEGFASNSFVEKKAKNHWQLRSSNAAEEITFSYRVYAFELSVRTSYVDADMAVLNGASVFLRLDTKEKVAYEVEVVPHGSWSKINTSLPLVKNDKWRRTAMDFDELVDSPILLGNQVTHTFDVGNVPHTVAMIGQASYDAKRLVSDMQKVCAEASKVVGDHPCKEYTFLVVNASSGSGGLEHANSCLLHTSRGVYTNEGQYKNFLGLVAHEYFHLWNVKRIRPIELGPFDYDNENYTSMLWVSEGFTSYYDDLICARAGIISADRFLEITGSNINTVENMPGDRVQPVSEASTDAWIKYYRSNENSANSTTNYYTKGSLLGLLVDLEIISETNGQKSLDDFMRLLYQKYYLKLGRGFTETEFQKELEGMVGKKMDGFFQKYVKGTERLPYQEYLSKAGVRVSNLNEGKVEVGLGVGLNTSGGKAVVASVLRNGPAWKYGINVNDEIIAIDNFRVGTDVSPLVNQKDLNDTLEILVNRDGMVRKVEVRLEPFISYSYRLERMSSLEEKQKKIYAKWLTNK